MADMFKTTAKRRTDKAMKDVSREDLLSGQFDIGETQYGRFLAEGGGDIQPRDDIIPVPLEDDNRRRVQAQRRRARRSGTGYQSTLLTETLG